MLRPPQAYVERRGAWRYRFGRPISYCVAREGHTWLGIGQTIELGAAGALISTDYPLWNGEIVEIRLVWPVLAQGVCPVMLVLHGTVIRSDSRGTAVRTRKYILQMEAYGSFDDALSRGVACNLVG